MERVLYKILINIIFVLVIKEIKNEFDRKWELLTINFPSELPPQRIELNFDFNGEISSELSGFYR